MVKETLPRFSCQFDSVIPLQYMNKKEEEIKTESKVPEVKWGKYLTPEKLTELLDKVYSQVNKEKK